MVYTSIAITFNGRVLTSFPLSLPHAIAYPLTPSLAVGAQEYLNRIQRAIDYGRMPVAPATGVELQKWYRLEVDSAAIGCCWFQWSGDKLYGIALTIKDGGEQNPPRDVGRVLFAWISEKEPWAHVVGEIPDTVADNSLAALPYMNPIWFWLLGGIGIVGLMGLVLVMTRK